MPPPASWQEPAAAEEVAAIADTAAAASMSDGHDDDDDGSTGSSSSSEWGAAALEEDDGVNGARREHAYVCLLHGDAEHFFLYALLVGQRLLRLCGDTDRVLLCAGRWEQDVHARAALARVFTSIHRVKLVNCPDATTKPRHSFVFTKMYMFRLPYKKLVFLDLDLVPRADLSALFDVPSPAGMYHGEELGCELEHGQPIKQVEGDRRWWCINAGVMRLDPCPAEWKAMLEEVRGITYRTALPEQYYLVDRIEGWRHLDPRWNMEVGLEYEDPGYTWPRHLARTAARVCRGRLWTEQAIEDVCIFHFSGTFMYPWWYTDMTPDEAFHFLSREFWQRDPRRLVAHAVHEWLLALQELEDACRAWSPDERASVEDVVSRLREEASSSWSLRGRLDHQCDRCSRWFVGKDGRWLVGWEGWWLCHECIVEYTFSDEAPEAPSCVACGSTVGGGWNWEQHSQQARWLCTTCTSSKACCSSSSSCSSRLAAAAKTTTSSSTKHGDAEASDASVDTAASSSTAWGSDPSSASDGCS